MPHLLQISQKNYFAEPKYYVTKPRKMLCSLISITKGITTKKAKASPLKEKDYCFLLQPKADHQGSKIPLRDFCWIGPSLVEKVLPNNDYTVRKLNTNKTQILHRIRLRECNPKKLPEDNYPDRKSKIISLFHETIYTPLHGKRSLVDTYLTFLSYILTLTQSILMNVIHRDQIVLLSHVLFCHDPSDGQNWETCPTSDPTVLHPSNPKSHGQSQDIETTADLTNNDSFEQISEPTLKLHTNLCHNHH